MSKLLLELRKKIKAKKPHFVRQDAHKLKKLPDHWRKPRGLQSKMRLHKKSYRRTVETGWGSPVEVKGTNKEGKKIIIVRNMKQLDLINSKTESVILSSSLGTQKRLVLLKKAKEKGITIDHINLDQYIKTAESTFDARIQNKKQSTKEKDEKKKKLEEKSKEKKEKDKKVKEEVVSDEEKKEKDKKELDKLLISKE